MSRASFKIGQLVATCGVAAKMNDNQMFYEWVRDCYKRYRNNDWGDLCGEDKASNDDAVKNGGRVFASYKYPPTGEKMYVIAEADRSVTTLLFADEY